MDGTIGEEATIPNGLTTAPAAADIPVEVKHEPELPLGGGGTNPPGDSAEPDANGAAEAPAPAGTFNGSIAAASEAGGTDVKAEESALATAEAMPAAIGSMLPPPVLPAPSAGTSTLLTAPPKLVLKLGKAATASLKAAAAAKAQKLAAATAAAAGGSPGATAAPPSPQAPEYSFPSASLSASSYGDLIDDRGGEASSSWAPSDHVASGDENVPLDIRDEVISPPTTFAEANAEGGIPKPHPGKARYVEVLGGKQCSICLHVLRAWAGTHIKSHESSNKHKEAIYRREFGVPLGGRRRKPKPPKKPREPKKPKDPNDPNSKRTPARVRKPKAVVEAEAEAAKGGGSKKVAESAAKKGTATKVASSPQAAGAAKGKGKKAAAGGKRGAAEEEDDMPFAKVAKRRRA